jgi:hypothetical protein
MFCPFSSPATSICVRNALETVLRSRTPYKPRFGVRSPSIEPTCNHTFFSRIGIRRRAMPYKVRTGCSPRGEPHETVKASGCGSLGPQIYLSGCRENITSAAAPSRPIVMVEGSGIDTMPKARSDVRFAGVAGGVHDYYRQSLRPTAKRFRRRGPPHQPSSAPRVLPRYR